MVLRMVSCFRGVTGTTCLEGDTVTCVLRELTFASVTLASASRLLLHIPSTQVTQVANRLASMTGQWFPTQTGLAMSSDDKEAALLTHDCQLNITITAPARHTRKHAAQSWLMFQVVHNDLVMCPAIYMSVAVVLCDNDTGLCAPTAAQQPLTDAPALRLMDWRDVRGPGVCLGVAWRVDAVM